MKLTRSTILQQLDLVNHSNKSQNRDNSFDELCNAKIFVKKGILNEVKKTEHENIWAKVVTRFSIEKKEH